MPRYREAVLSGRALRRLPDVEAIFVVSNAGVWDDTLRIEFTEQLSSPEAIQTVAGLLVPPGYGIEKRVLDALFDSDIVLQRLLAFEENKVFSNDSWVEQCVARLKSGLQGRNPTFEDS